MRNLNEWLDAYSVSHQNPINKKIHNVCVPAIMWSLFAILWEIPFYPPSASIILFVIGIIFYLRLNIKLAIFFTIFCALILLSIFYLKQILTLWPISLTVFVIAWIGQFIGHKIEGARPSFIEDIQFLLIGPIWVFVPILRKFIKL